LIKASFASSTDLGYSGGSPPPSFLSSGGPSAATGSA